MTKKGVVKAIAAFLLGYFIAGGFAK